MSPKDGKQPESKTNNWKNLPIVLMCHGQDYVIRSFICSLNKHLWSIQWARTAFVPEQNFKDDSVPAPETANLYRRERRE